MLYIDVGACEFPPKLIQINLVPCQCLLATEKFSTSGLFRFGPGDWSPRKCQVLYIVTGPTSYQSHVEILVRRWPWLILHSIRLS